MVNTMKNSSVNSSQVVFSRLRHDGAYYPNIGPKNLAYQRCQDPRELLEMAKEFYPTKDLLWAVFQCVQYNDVDEYSRKMFEEVFQWFYRWTTTQTMYENYMEVQYIRPFSALANILNVCSYMDTAYENTVCFPGMQGVLFKKAEELKNKGKTVSITQRIPKMKFSVP